jgi:hypothetical protein
MKFYNNLFVAYDNMLKRLRLDDTEFTSIVLVFVSQGIHILVILAIIRLFAGRQFLYDLIPARFYLIIFMVPWFVILYKYYSVERKKKIIELFNKKPEQEKIFWQLFAIITILIPIIIFPILFTKRT